MYYRTYSYSNIHSIQYIQHRKLTYRINSCGSELKSSSSADDRAKVGNITWNKIDSKCGFNTLYVGDISIHDVIYVIHIRYTSSVTYFPVFRSDNVYMIGVKSVTDVFARKNSAKGLYSSLAYRGLPYRCINCHMYIYEVGERRGRWEVRCVTDG